MDQPLAIDGSAYELVVERGWGVNSLAAALAADGLLDSNLPLKVYAKINRVGVIKAGEYLLVPGETPNSLLKKLAAGE